MCPQDDLFDIKMPEDNGASESNTDFVQDDSFMESLDFIDGLPEEDIPEGELPDDEIELDAGTPIDDEILLDVDMSGSSEEESASVAWSRLKNDVYISKTITSPDYIERIFNYMN